MYSNKKHNYLNLRQYVIYVILCVISFSLIMITNGLIPGLYLNDLSGGFLTNAYAECIKIQGIFSELYCKSFCLNTGAPFLVGAPHIYITAIISKITSIEIIHANILTSILFLSAGYFLTIIFLNKLGIDKVTSIFISTLWLINPIIWGHSGIPYLLESAALLPAHIFIDYLFFTKIESSTAKNTGTRYYIYIALSKIISIFMFGYIFIIYNLAGGLLLIAFILKTRKNKRTIIKGLLSFLTANLIAYLLYKSYIGYSSIFTSNPLEIFRAMGTDFITLFLPANTFWLTDTLNTGINYSELKLFGDGTNTNFNYLGYSILILFVLSLKIIKQKGLYVKTIIASGIIALILSFGPALKFNEQFDKGAGDSEMQSKINYSMTTLKSSINLHTDFLYKYIPGIKDMRATYRWIILFKLILLIGAAISLTSLKEKKKKILYYACILLITAELFPNIEKLNGIRILNLKSYKLFQEQITAPLKNLLSPKEKIIFLPRANDYLANFIATETNTQTYNCGGDKNIEISYTTMPSTIKYLNWDKNTETNYLIYLTLKNRLANSIIIPKFDLRWDSYRWPPKDKQTTSEYYEETPKNYPLTIKDYKFFKIIKLDSSIKSTDITYTIGSNIEFNANGTGILFSQKGLCLPKKIWTWTNSKTVNILLPLKEQPKSDLILSSTFFPFTIPGKLDNQIVDVYINNNKIGQWIASKEDTYKLLIPKQHISSSIIDLTFKLPNAISPKTLGINEDTRILGIGLKTLSISESIQ